MPDTKLSALTALAAAPVDADLIAIVDVSDTTMAASGTTKKITIANVFTDRTFLGSTGVGLLYENSNTWRIAITTGMTLGSAGAVRWAQTTASNDTADVILSRDAAAVLALKNSTNAQTLRIYGNTTGSHYLNMTHNGTNAVLSVNGGGTLHISSLPTANPGAGILWNNGGSPAIGT